MKLNRILFAALIASITGSSITSCSESFLDENLTTQYSTDRFKTQEGSHQVTGWFNLIRPAGTATLTTYLVPICRIMDVERTWRTPRTILTTCCTL